MPSQSETAALIEATQADGSYFVQITPDLWAWGIAGEVYGDSFISPAAAWLAASEDFESKLPELCDRCGDQAVCPDCVGT